MKIISERWSSGQERMCAQLCTREHKSKVGTDKNQSIGSHGDTQQPRQLLVQLEPVNSLILWRSTVRIIHHAVSKIEKWREDSGSGFRNGADETGGVKHKGPNLPL